MLTVLTTGASLGTLIQAFFSWTGYNRDSFGLNVGWRQSHSYHTKNYHMSWVGFAREDLKAMKDASVHHTSNYLMVTTLMMSSTVLTVSVASFGALCPTFVIFAFYTSAVSAVVFLMLGIMLGIKSQGSAYENTVALLTTKLRPHNPQPEHNYMNQAQMIEEPRSLFRVPGQFGDQMQKRMLSSVDQLQKRVLTSATSVDASEYRSHHAAPDDVSVAIDVPSEKKEYKTLEMMGTCKAGRYLSSFEELIHMWKPYEDFCKVCMGIGSISFIQTAAYFTVGQVVSRAEVYLEEQLSLTLSAGFLYLMLMIFAGYRDAGLVVKGLVGALLAFSFGAISVASAVNHNDLREVFVPAAFVSHTLFWLALYCMMQSHRECEPVLHAESHEMGTPHTTSGASSGVCVLREAADIEHNEKDEDFFSGEDRDHFRRRAQMKHRAAHQAVSSAMLLCVFMWLSMSVWAGLSVSVPHDESSVQGLPARFAQQEVLEVEWPGQRFRPNALGCGGGRVFAADRYNIYEVFPGTGLMATRVQCAGLRGPLTSISVVCEGQRCFPVALVRRADGERIINCTGEAALLGDGRSVEHFAIDQVSDGGALQAPSLWAVHENEVVQYLWDGQASGWRADWSLGKPSDKSGISGIAFSNSVVMLLRMSPGMPHVDLVSVSGGASPGRWAVRGDASSASSICALSDRSALILTADMQRRVLVKLAMT